MLDVRQFYRTEHLFSQSLAGDIGVEHELLLNVVAHLFAQKITSLLELLTESSGGNSRVRAQIADFPIQIWQAHMVHDATRV